MDINFIAPINNLSYGLTSVNILHALTKLGHKVALFPINPHNIEAAPKYHESIRVGLDNARLPNWDAPNIRLYHQFDMSQWVGDGPKWGFPIFELDKFTQQEIHHLAACNSYLTCSQWSKNILIEEKGLSYDTEAVKIVPLGVDTEIFNEPDEVYRKEKVGGPTVFFNAGKWEIRKGHDVLVDVFNRAFTPEDNVELWMMCDNVFYSKEENEQWRNLYYKSKLGSKVKFIDRVSTQEGVADIMKKTDFGIFLSRAEGWNLELLEMMACGKWNIVTDVTAHTEYCNRDNSNLITCTETEPAEDGKWFHGQGNWWSLGEDQIEQAVLCMRNYHGMKRSGNILNEEGLKTARRLSWENTANCIIQALES